MRKIIIKNVTKNSRRNKNEKINKILTRFLRTGNAAPKKAKI